MKLVVQPLARQDLKAAATYLAQRNPRAAARFSQAVEATFGLLRRFPRIGGAYEFSNPVLADIRVWPVRRFKNYLIYYRIADRVIRVIRVLHGAQDAERAMGI